MLIQLTFPSKTGKTIQTKVFDVPSRHETFTSAVSQLKSSKISGLTRKGAILRQIESYDGPIYRWDSKTQKYVSERKINAESYVANKIMEIKQEKENNFMRKVGVFLDVNGDDFRLLHKPWATVTV